MGKSSASRYCDIWGLIKDLGYADYLRTLQRYPGEPRLNHDSSINALIRRYRLFKKSAP